MKYRSPRRDYICERVYAIRGLSVSVPGDAFYGFINGIDVLDTTGVKDGDGLALKLFEGAEGASWAATAPAVSTTAAYPTPRRRS